MRAGEKIRLGVALVVLVAVPLAHGQTGRTASRIRLSSSASAYFAGEIVREIDDPHTGARWLLMRDPSHPGGPGRLLLAGGFRPGYRRNLPEAAPPRPVIHAGDRLIVEENTPLVESRLEGTALGPASPGLPLDVRLTIGGRVERVVAIGPGRAAFQAEARP